LPSTLQELEVEARDPVGSEAPGASDPGADEAVESPVTEDGIRGKSGGLIVRLDA
jgi:hypothetical protein